MELVSEKRPCGFFVREDIKFKPQNDLKLTFRDEYNKFQCYWIEILNLKNPNFLLGVYYRYHRKILADIHSFVIAIKYINGDFNYDILVIDQHNTLFDSIIFKRNVYKLLIYLFIYDLSYLQLKSLILYL